MPANNTAATTTNATTNANAATNPWFEVQPERPLPHHASGSPARVACLHHLALWPDGCGEPELLLAIEHKTGIKLADDELYTVLSALRRDERIAHERTLYGQRWFAPAARQAADVRRQHAAHQAQCTRPGVGADSD